MLVNSKSKRVKWVSPTQYSRKTYERSPNPLWKKDWSPSGHQTPENVKHVKQAVKKTISSLIERTVDETTDMISNIMMISSKVSNDVTTSCVTSILSGIVVYLMMRYLTDDIEGMENIIGKSIPDGTLLQIHRQATAFAIQYKVTYNTFANTGTTTGASIRRLARNIAKNAGDIIEQGIMKIATGGP